MPNTLLAKGEPKVSNEVVKEALEQMKTALVDAPSNVFVAQQCMKRAVDKKRRTKQFNIGNEVVLSTTNLRNYCFHLPPEIQARWVGPFSYSENSVTSCLWIGFGPRLADPSRLP